MCEYEGEPGDRKHPVVGKWQISGRLPTFRFSDRLPACGRPYAFTPFAVNRRSKTFGLR